MGLHGLPLGKTTANQNRVIRDLVGNLMRKAGERGRSSDQRARVERSRHTGMNWDEFQLDAKHQNEGVEQTYARPSVLERSNEPHDKGRRRKIGHVHVMDEVAEQIEVSG